MVFGFFTLIVALLISAIAAYYSIAGLTAIFSTAVVPIIIMGAALEIGKITAAIWLKLNWYRAKITYKLYLVPAVSVLMLLTSMGIFGFLSKAHSDQTLVTGNSSAQITLVDEKIKIQRENIETARRALAQLDAQVNERLSRGNTEQGVERSATLRRQQAPERTRLLNDITKAQNEIQKLNEQRAPLAAELRKVESEVGPIKYIAALIYGSNPDADLLEKAVSWMIIVIVAVFDPLALVLILAAQQSITWASASKRQTATILPVTEPIIEPAAEKKTVTQPEPQVDIFDISKHSYLHRPWVHFGKLDPMPAIQPQAEMLSQAEPEPIAKPKTAKKPIKVKDSQPQEPIAQLEPAPVTEFIPTEEADTVLYKGMKIKKLEGNYYEVNDKKYSQEVFYYMWPEIARKFDSNFGKLPADNVAQTQTIKSNFGTVFASNPAKGDFFLRVDFTPNKLFKYNGFKWIEVDKNKTDSYSYDDKYIQFVIDKLEKGEYDLDQLSTIEQELVAAKLEKLKNQ